MIARTPADLAAHHRVRHEVFVAEQGLFTADDRDDWDGYAATVHVLGLCGAQPAGVVRLYPLDQAGLWKGDRLAVLPAFRRCRVGGPLVRFAVATAGGLGGRRMIAYVQPQNVPFFIGLGWRPIGDIVPYVGQPHQQMHITLT